MAKSLKDMFYLITLKKKANGNNRGETKTWIQKLPSIKLSKTDLSNYVKRLIESRCLICYDIRLIQLVFNDGNQIRFKGCATLIQFTEKRKTTSRGRG